jgi:hypothetical protein
MYPVPVMTDVIALSKICVFYDSLRRQRTLLSCLFELTRQFDTSDGLRRAPKSGGKVTARAPEKQIFE